MGNNNSKQNEETKQKTVVEKPKEKDPWDIDELSEHRLYHIEYEKKLYNAINAYWDEVVLPGILDNIDDDDNVEDADKKKKEDDYPLQQDNGFGNNSKNLTDKVLFGDLAPGQKSKRKNLEYFTSDVYDDWTWVLYLDQMLEKQGNLPPLYERAIYHFKVKFVKIKSGHNDKQLFAYHNAETLAKNELHEFLWIFIGYQYWATNACEYTLGDEMVMFDFLCKLSLLFKVIMIGYNYEQYQYKKVVNHYMKPCLSNISKEVLNRAQSISIRKGLRKKMKNNDTGNDYSDQTGAMAHIYETIINRMEANRSYLLENGIEMKKL